MLNPESVDYVVGAAKNVGIYFTDSTGDPVLTVEMSRSDAMNLAKMIMEKCSYKAKLKDKKIE